VWRGGGGVGVCNIVCALAEEEEEQGEEEQEEEEAPRLIIFNIFSIFKKHSQPGILTRKLDNSSQPQP
jgi:hypothetical protein